MSQDFRSTAQFRAVVELYEKLHAPSGHIYNGHSLCGAADTGDFYFIGNSFDDGFESGVSGRLCRVTRAGGKVERINDRETRVLRRSEASRLLAVACAQSDAPGDRIDILADGCIRQSVAIAGRIEAIDWNSDGSGLLIVVAGTGADLAGIHGGYTQKAKISGPDWLPSVRSDEGGDLWRSVWIWDLEHEPRQLTRPPLNVWEASWCGPAQIAAVASDHHSEGSWYTSKLVMIDAATGTPERLHTPQDQLGVVRGSPDGSKVAFIRAFCSDRGIVFGDLCLIDKDGTTPRVIDTLGVDVTSIEWRSPSVLHLAGLRGHETVVFDHHLAEGATEESWASGDATLSGWRPVSVPAGAKNALFIVEAYQRAPVLAELTPAGLREIASLAAPNAEDAMAGCGSIKPFSWTAPDGLEIEGWLIRPDNVTDPTPLLVDVHGGPVSAHTNKWMAGMRAAPLLVSRGWTVFMPNPRGSTGRGHVFARAVKGDMGGADLLDILAGIDALVAQGLVDDTRVAMTGTSYGGFMSAWAPTQTERFAAVAVLSPVGNWYSQHRTTQIPEFDAIMLEASPWDGTGAYFDRSPALFRHRRPTPALIMAGGIDRSTPASQAEECYNAAVESGSCAELVIYPKAGHSMRVYPEYLDSAARILCWLERHVHPGKDALKEGETH